MPNASGFRCIIDRRCAGNPAGTRRRSNNDLPPSMRWSHNRYGYWRKFRSRAGTAPAVIEALVCLDVPARIFFSRPLLHASHVAGAGAMTWRPVASRDWTFAHARSSDDVHGCGDAGGGNHRAVFQAARGGIVALHWQGRFGPIVERWQTPVRDCCFNDSVSKDKGRIAPAFVASLPR
ncbi:MAG: hypothetical protein ABI538_11335 [Pseudoxanthomonas sp.]